MIYGVARNCKEKQSGTVSFRTEAVYKPLKRLHDIYMYNSTGRQRFNFNKIRGKPVYTIENSITRILSVRAWFIFIQINIVVIRVIKKKFRCN